VPHGCLLAKWGSGRAATVRERFFWAAKNRSLTVAALLCAALLGAALIRSEVRMRALSTEARLAVHALGLGVHAGFSTCAA